MNYNFTCCFILILNICSDYGSVAGFYEHGNTLLDSIKCGHFLVSSAKMSSSGKAVLCEIVKLVLYEV
jgi:hypothetical protein